MLDTLSEARAVEIGSGCGTMMMLVIFTSARLKELPLRGDDLLLLIFALILALIVTLIAMDARNPWK
jgi:hypothetical protein